jgi:hypothetical protein
MRLPKTLDSHSEWLSLHRGFSSCFSFSHFPVLGSSVRCTVMISVPRNEHSAMSLWLL